MLVNYWVRQGTSVQGPFEAEAVRRFIAEGKAGPGMLVSTDQINWRQACHISHTYIQQVTSRQV